MHVVATAGHVDHGKSTLVRALTGSDPDRLEEEHRRGLTIELGYCWTTLPEVGDVAFVDVPGHERFIPTMLSGIGPVPAVLFVVAADDPWMPQAAEHLAALDALGVSRGALAVTRSDLADPAAALARARAELDRTSLRGAPTVAVSARTGNGLDQLRGLLAGMVARLPQPSPSADVRLWLDRCFHVRGAGTVVTGTLPEGTVSVGDPLVAGAGARLRVRGVQTLGRSVQTASGVSRVALNISGGDVVEVGRGGVLVSPGRWLFTSVVDVQLGADAPDRLPGHPVLHVGATHCGTRSRPLGRGLARLTLDEPLPLRIGDRALLRDPGSRLLWGVVVLDPAPPPLRRRGAARARADQLGELDPAAPQLARELAVRRVVRRSVLQRIGVDTSAPGDAIAEGDWLICPRYAEQLREKLAHLVAERARHTPLDPGLPVGALAGALDLPEPALVAALVREPLLLAGGRVTTAGAALPDRLERALAVLEQDLSAEPFGAPTADRLRELGLDTSSVAAAVRAGRLLRLAEGVVLRPGADLLAVARLAGLRQPFTTSEARQLLGTTRRVALPLLDHLDRQGHTRRFADDRRSVRG
ncbi:MAG: SelB C-terminal domain-containing protein [Lapillicoccus sp.]